MNQNQKPTKSEVDAAINLQAPLVIENSLPIIDNKAIEKKCIALLNEADEKQFKSIYGGPVPFEVGETRKLIYMGSYTIEDEKKPWICNEFGYMEGSEFKVGYLSGAQMENAYKSGKLLTDRVYLISFLGKFPVPNNPLFTFNKYEIFILD